MSGHGKRYGKAIEGLDREAEHTPSEAIRLLKGFPNAKFDETVEVAFRLGIDTRKQDQALRGTVSLPHGTGKSVRVAVFAQGEKAREARDAGADVVGAGELVETVMKGEIDFDAAIATPDMMAKVGPLGKVLGPRGLMPNPKSGTVTNDVGRAVREAKGGKVEFRTDKFGIVHVPIGKVSFDSSQLHQNLTTLVDALIRNKPSASKGQYLRTFFLTSTQGPSVPVDVKEAAKLHTTS